MIYRHAESSVCCLDISFFFFFFFTAGNFRNMPQTVAERYQLQDFALEQMLEVTNPNKVKEEDILCVEMQNADPVFGRVKSISGDMVTVAVMHTEFNYHMHAYEIKYESMTLHEALTTGLRYPMPISAFYDACGTRYVGPRHILY